MNRTLQDAQITAQHQTNVILCIFFVKHSCNQATVGPNKTFKLGI